MEKAEQQALRQRMRELYAAHHSELGKVEEAADDVDDQPTTEPKAPKPPPGHIDTDATDSW